MLEAALAVRAGPMDPLKVIRSTEGDGIFWDWVHRAQGRNFSVLLCLYIEKNQRNLRHGALEISQHSAVPSLRSRS